MENTALIVSIALNCLLLISTGILIWDRFKPEQINLKCELIQDPFKGYRYSLVISNLTKKELKINKVLLNGREFQSFERRTYPVNLHPGNDLEYSVSFTKSNPRATACTIEVAKGRNTKTLEYSI